MTFSQLVLAWWDHHGRKDLPWQHNKTPYRVWVSEIMLQQTQVKTVIPYYERFMARFASVQDLAEADEDEVLHHWTGLGYYARARNLHKCAKQVAFEMGGQFPNDQESMMALPGIGRSTAAAILSIANQAPLAILDGNVKRVLSRYLGERQWPGLKPVENALWQQAQALASETRPGDYTQAMMDLGATLCTRSKPQCLLCPIQADCQARLGDLTRQIPASKPKKDKPVRQAIWLVWLNEYGEVLLHKRPSAGIWGGLHVFPQFETDQGLLNWLDQQGLGQQDLVKEALFRHTFSHYHLDIQPYVIRAKVSAMAEGEHHWYSLNQPANIGLAGPVAQWLQRLQNEL